MISGTQSATNGQTLQLEVPGGAAVVDFDGSLSSSQRGEQVTTWKWTITNNGVLIKTANNAQPAFSYSFTQGLYTVDLIVTDSGGNLSSEVTGIVSVAKSGVTSTGSMIEARADFAASVLDNGMVLVTGGSPGRNVDISQTAEIYNPATGFWRYTLSPMTTGRTSHTSTKLPDGRVLIVGGLNGNILASAEIFDPKSETFTPTSPMFYAHTQHRSILLPNGKVLVVAGSTAQCEIYDPLADTWSPAGQLPYAATRLDAALLPDGTVIAAGGYNYPDSGSPSAFVNLYDPTTNTWRSLAPMLVSRLDHTLTVLPDGRVLIVAGTDSNYTLNSVEIYDPTAGANGQSQLTDALVDDRRAHSATLLPNGDVLVAGGYQGDPGVGQAGQLCLASVQVFQHLSHTWSPVQLMTTSHSEHIASLLLTGKVLVAGGVNPAYLQATDLITTNP
jgi:PKD repeat protein